MRLIAIFATLAVILLSCGGPGAQAPTSTPQASSSAPQAARTPAAFLAMELTDVRSGARFTLSSLVGRTVIVEGMAVW